MEDVGERQLPGNARAADPWIARDVDLLETFGGCALSGRQQAVACCRMNRAQPKDAPAASAARPGWTAAAFVHLDAIS